MSQRITLDNVLNFIKAFQGMDSALTEATLKRLIKQHLYNTLNNEDIDRVLTALNDWEN